MTLVRRHLVAVVSLVLALATGIALGAGPLGREALVVSRGAPAPTTTPVDRSADELAEEVTPVLAADRLSGRSVTVISTPGADADDVAALAGAVEEAGGTVSAQWRVGRSLVASGETALVDTLGEQLLEQLDNQQADLDTPPYVRMGQLLGSAVATRENQAQVVGADATTIRQSLDAASLLTTDTAEATADLGAARAAPLVLVLLGGDVEDPVVEGLMTGIAERARRVVVTAPERAGDLEVLDEAGAVSTVDGSDGAAGRLAVVLTLAAPADQPPGSYGASGSSGVLPLG